MSDINTRIENIRKGIAKRAAAMKAKVQKQGFQFKPFSAKQKKVLTWWCPASPVKDMDGIIADGAIRSGKTLSMSLSYVLWAMNSFNQQNFGMAGKTIGSFRRNVLFWLKLMLASRKYTVIDKRSDNLLIVSKGNTVNYFYIFGGKDERSQDLIQGITLAGMFFDEVALMPESFVNQATGRLSVDGSKMWFNCNPDSPRHWFNQNWIIKAQKGEKKLLYLHFTMDDNLSLSDRIKERYRGTYVGVFFKRYILGLWCVAEGLVYSMFDEDKHVKDKHMTGEISIHTPTRGVTAKLHNFHCILRNNFTNLFNISIILSLSYYISIPFLSFLRKLLGANLPILFCVLSIRTDWFIESAHHPQPSPVQPLYFPLSSYTYLPNNKISNYLSLHQ